MARKDRPEPPLAMPESGAEDSDGGGGGAGGGGSSSARSRVPALRYLRSRSSSSTSSSEFEFTVSLSPASRVTSSQMYCPADDLFYKGQLLPLHLSPRLSMVRTLLASSPSSEYSASDTTSTSTTATGSRDSNGSSNDSTGSFSDDLLLIAAAAAAAECDSSRPSSVTEDDASKAARFHRSHHHYGRHSSSSSSNKHLLSSLATKFSSVFHRHGKKDSQLLQDQQKQQEQPQPQHQSQSQSTPVLLQDDSCVLNKNNAAETVTCYFSPLGSAGRRTSSASDATAAAREVIKKCVKKVKPLYEKISSLQHSNQTKQPACSDGVPAPKQQQHKKTFSFSIRRGGDKSTSSSSKSAQIIAAALRLRHSSSNNKPVPELGILGEMVRSGATDVIGDPAGTVGGDRDMMYPSSFSGNLRYPRRKRCSMAASCPSSMRSSPSHSGLLCTVGRGTHVLPTDHRSAPLTHPMSASSASMEELHSAIQGAIAHCKNTMKKGGPESDQI